MGVGIPAKVQTLQPCKCAGM